MLAHQHAPQGINGLLEIGAPQPPAATPTPLNLADRRAVVVAAYRRLGNTRLPTLIDVEGMPLDVLRASETVTNVLGPAVAALNAAGVPTEANAGAIMDALGLDQPQMDRMFCHCVNGRSIAAATAADRIAGVIDPSRTSIIS